VRRWIAGIRRIVNPRNVLGKLVLIDEPRLLRRHEWGTQLGFSPFYSNGYGTFAQYPKSISSAPGKFMAIKAMRKVRLQA
jgi:hypothetical protein